MSRVDGEGIAERADDGGEKGEFSSPGSRIVGIVKNGYRCSTALVRSVVFRRKHECF